MDKRTKIGKIGGKVYFDLTDVNFLTSMKTHICAVTEEDNIKYNLGAIDMMGTLVVEFDKDEFQNWKRTKNMDRMLDETI